MSSIQLGSVAMAMDWFRALCVCALAMALPAGLAEPRVFWVYGRQTVRPRFGLDRVPLYPKDIWTPFIRSECIRANIVHADANLTEHSDPSRWSEVSQNIAGKIIGAVLARPASVSDLMLYLGRQQRSVQDYWQLTPYHQCPVMFLEILAYCTLSLPQLAFSTDAGFAPKGLFTKITKFSAERCMNIPITDDPQNVTVAQRITQWQHRFNGGLEFDGFDEGQLRVLIMMPMPHAMLVNCGAWLYWGFPLATSRQGSALGLHLIKSWLDRVPMHPRAGRDEAVAELSIELLQGLADTLRAQSVGSATEGSVRFYTNVVQRIRDDMLFHRFGLSQRVYTMAHMVHCMLLSGLLACRGAMCEAITRALRIVIKETSICAYYVDLIESFAVVPSQTTLYRHRLTVHLGCCRQTQDVHSLSFPRTCFHQHDQSDMLLEFC